MGQGQSKEGTDNLSAQDAENDKSLNRRKKEQVKFAIAGRSATGKSTFINTIRNLKPGDDGFAKAGSGDTTITPTLYIHPKNDQISFYDLPGYSSTKFMKEDYISAMKISDYDFIFIFFNNVLGEDEIWLVGELRKLGKPFSLVRSKIDIDIDNVIYDGKDQENIIREIKEKIEIALNANPELKDTKSIFLISSRNPDLGEWSDLMTYIEDNTGYIPHIINMGQTKSKECADKKSTDNLSAQDAVNDIDILRRLAENEGPIAVSAYIDKSLNRWKKEQVKFAITGRSATGKSTFVNTIRNLRAGDDGFATPGSGDTTITPTLYIHPKNDQITFYDLPGYSSTTFKKEDYISEMKISDYDFVFIFFNNVLSEDEVWLVRELRTLGKPFSFVRSKIDIDIDNAIHDGKDQEMIIPEIKGKIKIALEAKPELKDTKGIFLISSRNPDLGEWSDLMTYIEDNIDEFKAQALLFSLDSITKKIVERKYKMLKKRLVVVTALAAGVAAIPVPCVDVAINTAILVHEVCHYMTVFGVNRQRVYSLKDFDHSLLKCTSLLKPNLDMMVFVTTKIGIYMTLLLANSFLDLILPLVGSVISSAIAARVTYGFLNDMLRDIKDDAVLIYEHVMKTNGDHRM